MKLLPSTMLALAWLVPLGLAPELVAVQIAQNRDASSPTVPKSSAGVVGVSPATFEVLKLVRAEVSEDAILAFIANSRNAYPLSADQIIYLKNAGVSSRVLTAMLSHKPSKTPAPLLHTPNATRTAPPQDLAAAPPPTAYVSPYPTTYGSYYYTYPYYYNGYWPYSQYYYNPGWSFSVGYNWGHPYYRYLHYKHYASHGYKHGHHPIPYPHRFYHGRAYHQGPHQLATHASAGVPASSRYVGATGRLTVPQSGFYPRGTYIGATGKIGPSSAFYSRGTYVGATGRMGNYRAAPASMGTAGFSRNTAVGRMSGMHAGGGFRAGGGGRR